MKSAKLFFLYANGVLDSIRKKTAKIYFGIYIFFEIVFLGGAKTLTD